MTYPAAAHHDEEHLLAAARLIDLLESSAPDAIGQQLRDFGQAGDITPLELEVIATRVAAESPAASRAAIQFALQHTSEMTVDDTMLLGVALASARRRRQVSTAVALVEVTRSIFGQQPIYLQLSAGALTIGGSPELRRSLELSEQALATMPDNPSALNSRAWVIGKLAQEGEDIDDAQLQSGLASVDRAIQLYDRPSYHQTRAKILRALGRFGEATTEIRRAIELEDQTSRQYQDRISEYLSELSLIDAQHGIRVATERAMSRIALVETDIAAVTRSLDEANQRADTSQVRLIETLAFFVAALALIQGSLNTLGSRPLWQALLIVVVLGLVLFLGLAIGVWALRRPPRARS